MSGMIGLKELFKFFVMFKETRKSSIWMKFIVILSPFIGLYIIPTNITIFFRIRQSPIKGDEIYRDFIPFYWALPYTKKDGDVRRDNVLMCYIFWKLAGIQYAKEGAYGSSYAKRGELEVFFNVSRKFDRLENIMLNG